MNGQLDSAELATLRTRIRDDRAELSQTIGALAAKASVRSRMRRRVSRVREALSRPAVTRPALVVLGLAAVGVAVVAGRGLRGSRRR